MKKPLDNTYYIVQVIIAAIMRVAGKTFAEKAQGIPRH